VKGQVAEMERAVRETEARLQEDHGERARLEERRRTARQLADECDALLAGASRDLFPRLETMSAEALGEHTLSVESCDNREREMREWIQARIDAEDKRVRALGERI